MKKISIWLLFVGIIAAMFILQKQGELPKVSEVEALNMLAADEVIAFRVREDGLELETVEEPVLAPMTPQLFQELRRGDVNQLPAVARQQNLILYWVFGAILFIFFIVILAKMYSGGVVNQVADLKQTRARQVSEESLASFDDIGGNAAAVELFEDIVDFLNHPKRWASNGVKLPRGVLVVGPPGTGKTLLARAVAGETNANFLYCSASEFVEMFVGIGAARVRDTFAKAAQQQPAVIFIDELDAVGRRRGSGTGTMHEEREQTLNQLLVNLDGIDANQRLVVIAATNRPDVLDPALLRSGRFDRMLKLEPPKHHERIEILEIHCRNKTLDPAVSFDRLAHETDGFTGADLATLANDAALNAVRRHRDQSLGNLKVSINLEDFLLAKTGMTKANRQYDRLDTLLVESVSQFAEPTGRAVAQLTLMSGKVLEGDVVWMNASHIKIRRNDGTQVIVAKELVEQLSPLSGTQTTPAADFTPDRWSGRGLDTV